MLGQTRGTKRFIIATIFFLAIFIVGLWIYLSLKPEPTCTDGIKNQNEEEIDCGGACSACIVPITGEALQIREVAWIPDLTGRYDAMAIITNPNAQVGARRFTYTFALRDASGRELAQASGFSWILPRETKTLLAFGLPAGTTPDKITVDISEVEWQPFADYLEKPKINIVDRGYEPISSGPGYSRAIGTIVNESAFDLQSVMVRVVLRDSGGQPLAVNQTEVRTVPVGDRRGFSLVFPNAFPGIVSTVEMEADADVFGSENFIKRYFPGGRYQDFGSQPRAF